VPPWRRGIGLLRQDPALFPHLTVRQNLEYGTGRARGGRPWPAGPAQQPGLPGESGSAATRGLAAELGLAGLLDDRPATLSGGQAHRVALGRLLLAQCQALLLDEPYTGLDAGLRRSLTALVRELAAARAVPAVLVAHELAEAQAFADRLAVLDGGRIVQDAPPAEVVLRPATRRVAELVGYRGFVPVPAGGVWGHRGPGASLGAALCPPEQATAGAGTPAVAGVHPERVLPGADPSRGLVLSGPVTACRPAGAGWEAEIDAGGGIVACRLPEPPGTGRCEITVLDPPLFAADGTLVPEPVPDIRQVRA
ncbi:MAG: ATP-binding cassette domain-containing protein, partial [Nocardiopsaceae bacterium]|jgi:iron(III) transport system ATP-binding protein|nr:ATP-binding cassette domain-containing protein [Nocardiopsaceae bacterium]